MREATRAEIISLHSGAANESLLVRDAAPLRREFAEPDIALAIAAPITTL